MTVIKIKGMQMSKSINLGDAKNLKNDEFYTKYDDIEKEINKYPSSTFKDKIILCNCDNPSFSQFYKFFFEHFHKLQIKKLICIYYTKDEYSVRRCIKIDPLNTNELIIKDETLSGNGDFRSEESISSLEEADLVITNPPFSLFREFIEVLMSHNKKFIIIGSQNAITYKDVFSYIKYNKIFIGQTFPKSFSQPDGSEKNFGNICWFTNVDYDKQSNTLPLIKKYEGNESDYPFYDNYHAIEVSKLKDIPYDFKGVMGVPITFLNHYNPKQFKIVGQTTGRKEFECHPSKKYINPKQYNPDGSISNGSKINTRASIKLDKHPEAKIYYSADNIDYPVKIVYARILIIRII